jgi:hypothetical protein
MILSIQTPSSRFSTKALNSENIKLQKKALPGCAGQALLEFQQVSQSVGVTAFAFTGINNCFDDAVS